MPHRNHLRKLMESYLPETLQQQEAKKAITDFVNNNPDCFLRSNLSGHLTGSAFLFAPDKKSVLLTHHKKLNRWLQLGGHADGMTNIFEVAKKEAQEESGIRDIFPISSEIFFLGVHNIPRHEEVPAHCHYDIKFLFFSDTTKYQISTESNELRWFHVKEIIDNPLFEDTIKIAIQQYIKNFL